MIKIMSQEVSKLQEIKDYRDHPYLNYSLLKKVVKNDTTIFKPSIHTLLGSVVDTLLTMPDEFANLYVIQDVKRPTSELSKMIKEFTEDYDILTNIEDYDLVQFVKSKNYGGTTWGTVTIQNKINELKDYWEVLKEEKNTGKEFVSRFEYNCAAKDIRRIKSENPGKTIKWNEANYQIPLFGEVDVRGSLCGIKSLPDIGIEHDNFIEIIDLKRTSYGLNNWDRAVKENYYLFQMSMIYDILTQSTDKPIKMSWLVLSSKIAIIPVDPQDIIIGRTGLREVTGHYHNEYFNFIGDKFIHGYKDAIAIYQDSQNLGLKDYDVEYHQNQGIFPSKSIFI